MPCIANRMPLEGSRPETGRSLDTIRRSLTVKYLSGSKRSMRLVHAAAWIRHSFTRVSDLRRSGEIFGQARKGRRWMPWRQEAMKDVGSCEKLRGAANQALIRRCPNGETRPGSCLVISR